MIEKTLITPAGIMRVEFPTYLKEVTLGQMIEMQERHYMNELEAISILSGIPIENLESVKDNEDFRSFGNHVHSLNSQIKYLYNDHAIPKELVLRRRGEIKKIRIAGNLSIDSPGPYLAICNIIANEINEHIYLSGEDSWQENFHPSLTACCQVLAHYLYSRVTGKAYHERAAEEFTTEIKKVCVTKALPIAKYFFTHYPDIFKQKTNLMQRVQVILKNWTVSRRLKKLKRN